MTQSLSKLLISILSVLVCFPLALRPSDTAASLLAKGLYFADLYNWGTASPLFVRAERVFHQDGDVRNTLYAHIGVLRTEERPIQLRTKELNSLLGNNKTLQSDKRLRLFALEVLGDLDGEIDSQAARRDWTEVIRLARDLNIPRWIYRAQGQIGFADYYEGDVTSCQRNVATALIDATQAGDVGAQVFFLSTTAAGFAAQGMPGKAISYANEAIALATKHPDVGEPNIAYEALITSSVETGDLTTAKRLSEQQLNKPLFLLYRGDVLAAAAELAVAEHNLVGAISSLEEVVHIRTLFGETRALPTIETRLSQLYASTGDGQRAEDLARKAVYSSRANEPPILLPTRLNALAQALILRGKYAEADQLYDSAAEIQDTMIGRADSVLTKTALISGASDLYSNHFSLLAEHFHDVSAAYTAVEEARGRGIAELLLSGRDTSPKALAMEREIAQLRLRLMNPSNSSEDIHQIRNAMFLAEESRAAHPDVTILSTTNYKPVDIKAVQSSLAPSEVILEYVLSEPRSYCLVIGRSLTRIVQLSGKGVVEAQIANYLEALKVQRFDQNEAQALYRCLMAPIAETTKNKTLIIIPDGELHRISFDALMDEGKRYVVESKTILYAPSATTFYLLRRNRVSSTKQNAILAVGGVPYGNGSVERAVITRGYSPQSTWDLPASTDEARAAVGLLPDPHNRLLLNTEATETAFKAAQSFPLRSFTSPFTPSPIVIQIRPR